MKRLFLAGLLALASLAHADDALWARLKAGGNVLLIRHAATEPGLGDPPNFFLGDCKTQRNLSEAGREEARRVGRALKWRAVAVSEVRASQWCRTLETAELAFGHPPVPWEALNSLHKDPDREAERTRAVAALIATVRPPQNVALVTHNFNIRALTGISPSTAEIVVVRGEGGKVVVVGRLPVQ
ncbi:MAG: phosphoglycerate mutase [Betaproteobacteria bacterium]|jgi:phosphohistidine phosphatase SixA|nr:MAG: phosphoglycerate mutase [Betaproteobacteria bacterium]